MLYFAFGTPGMDGDILQGYLKQVEEYVKVLAPSAETMMHMLIKDSDR